MAPKSSGASPLPKIWIILRLTQAQLSSGGKLYYGVFGDTDGDSPEEIGEASWLMANTCFPSEGLNGGNGHPAADVTCKPLRSHTLPREFDKTNNVSLDIFFTGSDSVLPSSAIGNNYLTNFSALKNLGDSKMRDLAAQLKL